MLETLERHELTLHICIPSAALFLVLSIHSKSKTVTLNLKDIKHLDNKDTNSEASRLATFITSSCEAEKFLLQYAYFARQQELAYFPTHTVT